VIVCLVMWNVERQTGSCAKYEDCLQLHSLTQPESGGRTWPESEHGLRANNGLSAAKAALVAGALVIGLRAAAPSMQRHCGQRGQRSQLATHRTGVPFRLEHSAYGVYGTIFTNHDQANTLIL
jgi:hypothetical protein